MLVIFHFLLVTSSTDALTFETNTVIAGDHVNLTCTRQTADYEAALFWIRLVSGNPPNVLGGTYSFNYMYDNVKKISHMTARQEPGAFLLQINSTEQSDAGVYYCLKVDRLNMVFVKGVFLRVKGPEPDVTAIIQEPPSDPGRAGDSVTLRCSVVSENRSCPTVHSVYWFTPGSGEAHPSLIYASECERRPEAPSPPTCVRSFCKNVSSSDAGTYHCAVATCGQILFGKGTKLDVKVSALQEASVVVVLSAALAISLVVIVFLTHKIKKTTCGGCSAAPQTAGGDQTTPQSVTYSAVSFTKTPDKPERSQTEADSLQ